jgi:hypothetical protein
MNAGQFFEKLEFTGNNYSTFQKGRKYVYFSTGGWSENEELIERLKKERIFNFLLYSWKRGGHYVFEIPSNCLMGYDI